LKETNGLPPKLSLTLFFNFSCKHPTEYSGKSYCRLKMAVIPTFFCKQTAYLKAVWLTKTMTASDLKKKKALPSKSSFESAENTSVRLNWDQKGSRPSPSGEWMMHLGLIFRALNHGMN